MAIQSKIHREVWDRQPGEGTKRWEAFLIYRELPSETRALRIVADQLGKSQTLMERWSGEEHWVARSKQYDENKKRQLSEEKQFTKFVKQTEMLDRHTSVWVMVQNKVVQVMQGMTDEDWKKISFATLIQVFNMASLGERLARGLPEKILEVRSPEQMKVQVLTEAKLFFEEERQRVPESTAGSADYADVRGVRDRAGGTWIRCSGYER